MKKTNKTKTEQALELNNDDDDGFEKYLINPVPEEMNVDDYSDYLVLTNPEFLEELDKYHYLSNFNGIRREMVKNIHRPLVQKAVSENKVVFLGVLLDYGDEPWADLALFTDNNLPPWARRKKAQKNIEKETGK